MIANIEYEQNHKRIAKVVVLFVRREMDAWRLLNFPFVDDVLPEFFREPHFGPRE